MNLLTKQKRTFRHRKQTWLSKGWGTSLEFEINIYTLVYKTEEKEMATHSSVLAWESHGQRSLAGYSPWGRKRVRNDLVTKQRQ